MQQYSSSNISPGASHRRGKERLRSLMAGFVALVAVGGLSAAMTPGAQAADNPYERGPAPTTASIEAPRGPYAVSETTVSSLSITGFGGGTVYYPTSTSDGTFGAVAVSPGFTASQSSIAWLRPRLASQGFVVFTIDTNSTLDQPAGALLREPAVVARQGVPGTQQRDALHAEHVQHHHRQIQRLLAQAVHRQRHPLRAVPLPAAAPEPDD